MKGLSCLRDLLLLIRLFILLLNSLFVPGQLSIVTTRTFLFIVMQAANNGSPVFKSWIYSFCTMRRCALMSSAKEIIHLWFRSVRYTTSIVAKAILVGTFRVNIRYCTVSFRIAWYELKSLHWRKIYWNRLVFYYAQHFHFSHHWQKTLATSTTYSLTTIINTGFKFLTEISPEVVAACTGHKQSL